MGACFHVEFYFDLGWKLSHPLIWANPYERLFFCFGLYLVNFFALNLEWHMIVNRLDVNIVEMLSYRCDAPCPLSLNL